MIEIFDLKNDSKMKKKHDMLPLRRHFQLQLQNLESFSHIQAEVTKDLSVPCCHIADVLQDLPNFVFLLRIAE